MKTLIEYHDGKVESYEDQYPVINREERTLTTADEEDTCGDDVPVDEVKRVIFEP